MDAAVSTNKPATMPRKLPPLLPGFEQGEHGTFEPGAGVKAFPQGSFALAPRVREFAKVAEENSPSKPSASGWSQPDTFSNAYVFSMGAVTANNASQTADPFLSATAQRLHAYLAAFSQLYALRGYESGEEAFDTSAVDAARQILVALQLRGAEAPALSRNGTHAVALMWDRDAMTITSQKASLLRDGRRRKDLNAAHLADRDALSNLLDHVPR